MEFVLSFRNVSPCCVCWQNGICLAHSCIQIRPISGTWQKRRLLSEESFLMNTTDGAYGANCTNSGGGYGAASKRLCQPTCLRAIKERLPADQWDVYCQNNRRLVYIKWASELENSLRRVKCLNIACILLKIFTESMSDYEPPRLLSLCLNPNTEQLEFRDWCIVFRVCLIFSLLSIEFPFSGARIFFF